jgi:predicted dehydrogenase
VKWLLCEKPLGMTLASVEELQQPVTEHKVQVYTALLMNFSEAIAKVMDLMREKSLIVVEGAVTWGKNRYYDPRPTPGDEDETVHGFGILHTLVEFNQRVLESKVEARRTLPHYADPKVQEKAHALDPSFPLRVSASTMALEDIRTDLTTVRCILHSSFIHPEEIRCVTAVLADKNDPLAVKFSVKFTFDQRVNGTLVDELTVTKLAGNTVMNFPFVTDKLAVQTAAFLTAASGGKRDPRLTTFAEAMQAVAFTDAVVKSDETGEYVVTYSE